MSGFVAAVLLRKWDRDRALMPYFTATALLTTAIFVGVVLFITDPFERLWHVPGASELTKSLLKPASTKR